MSSSAVKRKLSGSTNGKAIKVVQTGTLGDTIHTAVKGTTGDGSDLTVEMLFITP
jgi:Fe2+ transport system protein FeoA